MKRRNFIKKTALTTAAISMIPYVGQSQILQDYSRALLIGKGTPDFLGSDFKLERATFEAFTKMKTAAALDGIDIEVVSAYRNYDRQNAIWTRKYKAFTAQGLHPLDAIKKIVEYSTIPGTSRHHWGTDIDMIDGNAPRPESVLQAKHFHGKGPFCKFKEWMNANATSYGFYEVYSDNANRKGFKYEPWHFSYLPTSKPLLAAYRKLDVKTMLREEKLIGSEHFTKQFIDNYVQNNILDINPALL
ncbi:MAG: M15 family metallopeptidase [Gilvibacter sp.]